MSISEQAKAVAPPRKPPIKPEVLYTGFRMIEVRVGTDSLNRPIMAWHVADPEPGNSTL